jgi:hypothetical protein
VHEREALLDEGPAQERLDDVCVEDMRRAGEEHGGQHIETAISLFELDAEAETPEPLIVPDTTRPVRRAVPVRSRQRPCLDPDLRLASQIRHAEWLELR